MFKYAYHICWTEIVLFFCSPKRKVPKEKGAASDAGRGLRGVTEESLLKGFTRNNVGERDDMALVGIVSTQLLHHHFVEDFKV